MQMESKLASRTKQMGVNAIREILKVVSDPGMISLAGGIPAPESFPLDLMGPFCAGHALWPRPFPVHNSSLSPGNGTFGTFGTFGTKIYNLFSINMLKIIM